MSRLGWRSWLVLAVLLLWLMAGIGLSVLVFAANPASRHVLLLGVPLSGTILPILMLANLPPAGPPSLPQAGQVFSRSRGMMLGFSLLVLAIVSGALLLLPFGAWLLATLAQEAWAADKFVKAAFFALFALLVIACVSALTFIVPWRLLRPAWRRRRWPFAVLGAERLWIDGHDLLWQDLREVTIVRMRMGTALALASTGREIRTLLFPLAGSDRSLHDAIRFRLAEENDRA